MKPAAGGGGLPGMKPGAVVAPSAPAAAPGAPAVPPFLQRKPSAQEVAQQQAIEAQKAAVAADQKIIEALSQTSIDDAPMISGKAKKTLIYASVAAAAIGIGLGFMLGIGLSGRQELNITIRDALIIEYELKEAGKLFNETQTVISTALAKAAKHEFDEQHLAFLKSNITGNPMKPTLLTERNYKRFDAAAVQWLVDYFKKWDKLYGLIQEHRRSTEYDLKALQASGAAAQRLMETNYGVVFKRDKQLNGAFVANLVVIGAGDGTKFQVQVDTSTYADERMLYNPPGEDSELTKDPEKYVVQLGPESKGGLLANATQSHFKKYVHRLKEISDLMTGMAQNQKDLLDKISAICSQDPAWGVDPDPEEGLQEYIQRSSAMSAAAAE